jgi:predicted RNA-binding protein YlqC (UPF0109 family)
MARALVESPDAVSVQEIAGGQSSLIELRVAQPDLGSIIGKAGRNVDALRTILSAASAKHKRRVILDVIE